MSYQLRNNRIVFIFTLLIPLSVCAQNPAPSSINQEQAKYELDQAAVLYRDGNFAEAQAHAELALQLDPENKVAPYLVARIIHAQYRPGVRSPENQAKANEAIAAYQRILQHVPNDDEAYKAIAYLYGSLKEEELLRQWILKRAVDSTMSPEKRSEAYTVLASKDWDCSWRITELRGNKITTVNKNNQAVVNYQRPTDQAEFERAEQCANHGLEMSEIAISLSGENESAWSYKTNILLELSKLAEMSGDVQRKSELQRQYQEALAQTTKLSKANQARREKGESNPRVP